MILAPQYQETDARVFTLARIRPSDTTQSRVAQARDVFEKMEAALREHGMSFTNVVRTSFHLDDILAWYDDFNAVRNAFFKEHHVFGGVVPASTGVGMPNEYGAAVLGAVLAIKPLSPDVRITPVASPLQCPAVDYRSAFSRAVEVQLGPHRHLYVSGTASIDPDGSTAHVGDLDAQIRLTLQVVGAILQSRDMTWKDTRRAIAYFAGSPDPARLALHCRSLGIPVLPVRSVQATICRDDLLFEIELDAVSDVS